MKFREIDQESGTLQTIKQIEFETQLNTGHTLHKFSLISKAVGDFFMQAVQIPSANKWLRG